MTFVLDATTRALKITIDAGAGADVQFVATYADSTSTTFTKGSSQGVSNGSTAVDVVSAPAASTRRVVKAISFYNANATDPRTVTFDYDDNGTPYTIAKFTLQAGQSWYTETASTEEKGATILDATNRAIKFSIDVAGSDVQYTAAWADSTDTAFTQGSSRGLSNGTSAVTIVGAPAASTRRLVQSITFYNAHASSTRVVTLFYDDNGTARTIAKFSLLAGESWFSEVATFGFQPAGSVYAAPSATAGPPSFRLLALTDLATTTGGGSVVLQTTPTIVTPRINEIRTSTNPFRAVLSFVQVANSANYLQLSNAATGAGLGPILETIGTGTDINFELKSKGFGNIIATTAGLTIKPIDSTVSGALAILGGTGTSAGGQLAIRTNGNNEIVFRTPDNLAASVYYVLPAADGTNGQVLSTNGSGVLSWVTASGGGGISDGDKGDITVSGSGATWTIDNGVVTLAKMADLATDRLIGRDSSGTGVPESLTVGGGIEFTGSGGIQTSAFTGDVTKTAGGTSTTIANDAVTFAKMQNITSGVILGRTTASTGDVEEITPGSGVLAWLQDATSAKLATAITDETGSGSLVFGTSPTLTTPRIAAIHTASSPNNAALAFAQVASSVNYLQITNAATTGYPILEAIGTDADIGIALKAKGTGHLQIDADRVEMFGGDLFIYDNRSLVLFETSNVDFIAIAAPASLASSMTYTLPAAYGATGQALSTDSTGTLSWATYATRQYAWFIS